MSVVVLAKSSAEHSRGSVLIMLRTLAILAMFSSADVTILHLAVFSCDSSRLKSILNMCNQICDFGVIVIMHNT